MSGEHLWSTWTHPHLPTVPNPRNWTAAMSQSPETSETIRKKPRMGHTFTKKIRCVCKRCNETWMGEIENAVKPILTPMILGHRTTLDHLARRSLAEWLTLKFMISDADRDATPISTKAMLAAFRKGREIPKRLKIWVSHHNAFEWSAGAWSRGLTVSFSPRRPRGQLRSNVKTHAFGIGHLFTLTFLSRLDEIDLEIDNRFTAKLWPVGSGEVAWPLPLIPRYGIGALANVIDEFESRPDCVWGST